MGTAPFNASQNEVQPNGQLSVELIMQAFAQVNMPNCTLAVSRKML